MEIYCHVWKWSSCTIIKDLMKCSASYLKFNAREKEIDEKLICIIIWINLPTLK